MRRGLGRGRALVGIGAVICLLSMMLDWYTVGGQALPATRGNGFEGSGIVIFVAAIALLALLALPYASREGRAALDRPLSFLVLSGVALTGYALRLIQLYGQSTLGLPDRAPGLWLGGVGLLLVAWGVTEIVGEPVPAP